MCLCIHTRQQQTKECVVQEKAEADAAAAEGTSQMWVAQKYIEQPLIINRRSALVCASLHAYCIHNSTNFTPTICFSGMLLPESTVSALHRQHA